MTASSVPIMLTRIVSELKLGQYVLDYSLALMGLPVANPKKRFLRLPPPLKRAAPHKIQTEEELLGVIVIACKLSRDYSTMQFERPFLSNRRDQSYEDGSDEDGEEVERNVKRRKVSSTKRFVPSNEEEFRLLANGPLLEGYLDFVDDQFVYGDSGSKIMPKFNDLLKRSISDAKNTHQAEANKLKDESLGIPRQHPIIYSLARDPDQGADLREVCPDSSHPKYFPQRLGLFVEYLAYRTGTNASKIIAVASSLDKAITERIDSQESSWNIEMTKEQLYNWIGNPESTSKHEPAYKQPTIPRGKEESASLFGLSGASPEDMGSSTTGSKKKKKSADAECIDPWWVFFDALQEYDLTKYINPIPDDHMVRGRKLKCWLHQQLKMFKQDRLDPEKAFLLDKLGALSINKQDRSWTEKYNLVKEFKLKHNNLNFVNSMKIGRFSGKEIQNWLSHQRQKQRSGRLKKERKDLLDEIGLNWDTGKEFTVKHKERWDIGLKLMKQFIAREGHKQVPKNHIEDGFDLGQWVFFQERYQRRFNPERLRQLDELGMLTAVGTARLRQIQSEEANKA